MAIGGILVAFATPLFLSLVQSTLVQQILSATPEQNRYTELLIFAGICIVASYSSPTLMTNLSQKALADIAKTKEDVAKTKKDIAETKELAKEAREQVIHVKDAVGEDLDLAAGSLNRINTQTTAALESDAAPISLSQQERKTLRAVGRLTMRTATGIAKDADIPRNQVGEVLDELTRKGLVEKASSPNTGGLRHRVTPLGIAVLNKDLREG